MFVNKQFTETEIANKHKKFNLTSYQENTNLNSNEDCAYNGQKLKKSDDTNWWWGCRTMRKLFVHMGF